MAVSLPSLCSLYVDLNPVRAGLAKTPEDSKYTGACDRIEDRQEEEALQAAARECSAPAPLNLMKLLTRKHAGWMAPLFLVWPRRYPEMTYAETVATRWVLFDILGRTSCGGYRNQQIQPTCGKA